TLWHQRLGHPADPVLDVLKSSLNLDRAVWIYMLKGKDDVYDSIVSFAQMITNQFETNVKTFRSDNGYEFVNNKLQRIPSSVLSGKSPYIFVYGHDLSLSHFRVFGCLCYATILNNYDKFSSRDVKFYETDFPFKMKYNLKKIEFESGVTKLNHKNFFDNEDPKRPNDEGRVSSNNDGLELSPDNNNQDFINDFDDSEINSDTEELPVNNLRRTSRQTKLPSSLNDFIVEGKVKFGVERVVNYANLKPDSFCFATALNKSIEPKCYEDVMLDSNWIDAMNSKSEALNENQTWFITDLPPRRKAIGNKWIYKIKYKSSGDINRYKARLVVKGCSKKEGVDFDETFSHVVKMSTVRCLIALSVTNNWPLFQLVVNNAFLYGDIDEDIYMTIPKGMFGTRSSR
ncbi:ribonuclease H-like domain-containing protein, partial [Tanacetum coccineum]